MNRVLLLLLLFTGIIGLNNPTFAQTETTAICGVSNPVQELDWLVELIATERPSKIETYTYDSSKVFVVYDANFANNLEAETYTCSGDLLCVFRGIIDPFDFPTDPLCLDINTYYSDKDLIYECNCGSLYRPVCGRNGVTYINSCFAECAGVTFVAGQCSATTQTEEPADTLVAETDPIVVVDETAEPDPIMEVDSFILEEPIIDEEVEPVFGEVPVDSTDIDLPIDSNLVEEPDPIEIGDTVVVEEALTCSCDSLAWLEALIVEANAGQSCLSSINKVEGTDGNTYFTTGGDYDCITGGDPGIAVDPVFPVYNCLGEVICHTGFINSCYELGIEFTSYSNCWQKADDCDCPSTYEPVCGSNGFIYDNACLAHCDFIHEFVAGNCTSTNSHTICAGDSVYLVYEPYVPEEGDTFVAEEPYPNYPYFNEPLYTWTPSTGLSCTDCDNPIASPDSTTTYMLTTYNLFASNYWMPIYRYYEVTVEECAIDSVVIDPIPVDSLVVDPIVDTTSLVCGVENPLADLEWLATIVTEEYPSKVEQRTYEGNTVFLIFDRNFDTNLSIRTYTCSGDLLCIFAGIIDPFNPPTDPLCPSIENYTDPEVIYTCDCSLAYAPVCGANGITYVNACFAACSGVTTYESGQCVEVAETDSIELIDPIVETDSIDIPEPIYNPSTCSCDSLDFLQAIIADANAGLNCYNRITKYTDSLGNNYFGLTDDYECLTGGNPYIAVDANTPVYNCDGDVICEQGIWNTCYQMGLMLLSPETCWEKADDCDCPSTYEPVCGSNGLVYDNACLAQCDFISDYTDGICEPHVVDTICLGRGTYLQSPILSYPGDPNDLLVGPDEIIYNWSPADGLSCTTCQNPYTTPTETTTYLLETYDFSSPEYWKPVYYYYEVVVEDCGTLPAVDTCTDDPLALEWIQDYIVTHQPSGIEIATLHNEQVFVIHPNPAIADMPTVIYDCEGNYICSLGGFYVPYFPMSTYCFDLQDDLTDRTFIYECDCTFMYEPVCGENGQTYINACYAQCAGVDYIAGDCSAVCFANTPGTLEIDANTGGYLVTVLNNSGADNNVTESYYVDSSLVAGIDVATYVVFNLYNDEVHCVEQAACVDSIFAAYNQDLACPDFSFPVCGCNDVTYNNSCEALIAGVTNWTQGACQVNTAPVAVNDNITAESGVTVKLNMLLNDYDAEGDSIVLTAIGSPTNGTLYNFGTKYYYQSDEGFEGTDSFNYQICDTYGSCSEGTVTIKVHIPKCEEITQYCTEPMTPITICPEFCNLDDTGINIRFIRSRYSNIVTPTDEGCFEFTPLPTFTGRDRLRLAACDMNGNCQRLRITVVVDYNCGDLGFGKLEVEEMLIEEVTMLEGIQIQKVYPVPAQESVNIRFQSLEAGNVQLALYDITGKLLQREELDNNAGIYQHQMDLSNYSAGLYVIYIQVGETQVSTKFIKE